MARSRTSLNTKIIPDKSLGREKFVKGVLSDVVFYDSEDDMPDVLEQDTYYIISKSRSAMYNTPLTMTALDDGIQVSFTQNTIYYSLNDGNTWDTLSPGDSTPAVKLGGTVMFRCTTPTISESTGIGTFTVSGRFSLSGNVLSMLFGDSMAQFDDISSYKYAFRNLFSGCTGLTTVSKSFLPAQILSEGCYWGMFYGCTALTTAPDLPATKLVDYCYRDMFSGCTSLSRMKVLFIEQVDNAIETWMYNVSTTGMFIKMSNTNWDNTVIPSTWTIVELMPIDV